MFRKKAIKIDSPPSPNATTVSKSDFNTGEIELREKEEEASIDEGKATFPSSSLDFAPGQSKRLSKRLSFLSFASTFNNPVGNDSIEEETVIPVSPLTVLSSTSSATPSYTPGQDYVVDFLMIKGAQNAFGFGLLTGKKNKVADLRIDLLNRSILVSSKLENDQSQREGEGENNSNNLNGKKDLYRKYRSCNITGIRVCKSADKTLSSTGSGGSLFVVITNQKEEIARKWKFGEIETAKEVERIIQTMNTLGPRLISTFERLKNLSEELEIAGDRDSPERNLNMNSEKEQVHQNHNARISSYLIPNARKTLSYQLGKLFSNSSSINYDQMADRMIQCICKVHENIESRYKENQKKFLSTLTLQGTNGGRSENKTRNENIKANIETTTNPMQGKDKNDDHLNYRDFFMFFVNMNYAFYLDSDPIISWYMYACGKILPQIPEVLSPPRGLGLNTSHVENQNKKEKEISSTPTSASTSPTTSSTTATTIDASNTNFITGLSDEAWKPILLGGEEEINILENVICIINPHVNTKIKSQGYLFITNYRLHFIASSHELHSNVYDIPDSFARISIPFGMIEVTEKSVHEHTPNAISRTKLSEPMISPISRDTGSDFTSTFDFSSTTNNEISSSITNMTDYIKISTKDLRTICFAFRDTLDSLDAICCHIDNLTFLHGENGVRKSFAYKHQLKAGENQQELKDLRFNGWNIYSPEREFCRLRFIGDNAVSRFVTTKTDSQNHNTDCTDIWRTYCDNFKISPTYPRHIILPAALSISEIHKVAKYRSRQRLPAAVWRAESTGAILARCAQPLVGLVGNRSALDERLLDLYRCQGGIRTDRDLYIVDCRKQIAAFGNQLQGKGTENMENYAHTNLLYLNIENIHIMRNSLDGIRSQMTKSQEELPNTVLLREPGTVYSSNGGSDITVEEESNYKDFYEKFDESGWLTHISRILRGSLIVAEKLHIHGCSVIVHCSDGWDRTPQITATPQLLLDKYYRTLEGFAVLIEKEWCSFGHKFHDRCGHFSSESKSSQERSPCFVQWLDVIYQIMTQFPYSFEFNENLLLFLADHVYSGLYGNFLGNSEKERQQELNVEDETISIWTTVFLKKEIFTNKHYSPQGRELKVEGRDESEDGSRTATGSTVDITGDAIHQQEVLWPSANLKKLHLWERYFLRGDAALHPRKNSGIAWPDLLNLAP